MKIKNKNLALMTISSLLILAVGLVFIFKLIRREKQVDGLISLEEAMVELDYSYKSLENPFPEIRPDTVTEKIGRVYDAWEVFMSAVGNVQPPEFARTRNWQRNLIEISGYSRKAYELVREDKEGEAVAEMEKAFTLYAQIKKENNVEDSFLKILEFYKDARRVGLAGSKEEAAVGLEDLKLIFTEIKEPAANERYRQLIIKLELAIMDIERLLPGPDFKKAQSNLIAGAEEMYWKY